MISLLVLHDSDIANRVAKDLNTLLNHVSVEQFADGELNIVLKDPNVYRNKNVVIIQSTGKSVNETVLALAFCAQELKNAGAKKIIAVIPYYGYSRQERSNVTDKPGHGVLVAELFKVSGIDQIITIQLHNERLIEFASLPIINVNVVPILADLIIKNLKPLDDLFLVAPDRGAYRWVQAIAQEIGVPVVVFEKERFAPDQTRIVTVNGNIHRKHAVIIDDIISTGSTAIHAAEYLSKKGVEKVYGIFVHPVLPGNALERIEQSIFNTIYVGNTLPLPESTLALQKIQVFDVSAPICEFLKGI